MSDRTARILAVLGCSFSGALLAAIAVLHEGRSLWWIAAGALIGTACGVLFVGPGFWRD